MKLYFEFDCLDIAKPVWQSPSSMFHFLKSSWRCCYSATRCEIFLSWNSPNRPTDLLPIITSTADERSIGTNIDDLERPW